MKTNIKVTFKSKPSSDADPKVGDYFRDVTTNYLYIVVEILYNELMYVLVNVVNGKQYAYPVREIRKVFWEDNRDFEMVEDVSIVVGK